jgi:hypothetical protein
MMVRAISRYHHLRKFSFLLGTGLVDGFPPGGVDAHDVSPSEHTLFLSPLGFDYLPGEQILHANAI